MAIHHAESRDREGARGKRAVEGWKSKQGKKRKILLRLLV